MRARLILTILLEIGVCISVDAEQSQHTASTADKERQLQVAQRLYEEGEKRWKEGKYGEAERLLKQTLEVRERLLDPEHVEVAACLHRLGTVYMVHGQYERAEALLQRALRSREAALGSNHPEVATSLNNLAILYWDQGQYDRAEPLYQRALRIREATLGPSHSDVAQTLNNLANLYWTQGRYDRAEPLHQRALRIREATLGSNHPEVATSLNNLALLYWTQGQYDQAEPLHQRALRIWEATLGPDHPEVATSLNNLANLYRDQGQYDRAEPLHQRALRIKEASLGINHPEVATSLNNLAILHLTQGQYDKAEPLYQRALRIREATLGPNHPAVATSLNNLALLYWTQGQYGRAEPLYQRALRIQEAILRPNHPDLANSLNNLANLYRTQGQYDRAEPLYQRALRIREAALGSNHPYLAEFRHELALLYSLERKLPQALLSERIAFDCTENRLRSQGLVLADVPFSSLLSSLRKPEEDIYSTLLQHHHSQSLARLALSITLLRKGRTADEAAQLSRAVYHSLSEGDRQQFDRLRALRSHFSSLSLAGPGQMNPARYRTQLEELDAQANNIEADLARHSARLRAHRNLPGIDKMVQQVAAHLPTGSTLVELVTFRRKDFHLPVAKQPSELHYLAFVLTPNGHVSAIDLGQAKPIDESAARLHVALSDPSATYEPASRDLFNKLMVPLLPTLGAAKQLILSLDGQLHLIPFDVLHDGQRFLGDRFQISYVTSGRDLLPRELSRPPATDVVVLADPDYGAPLSAPPASGDALALGSGRGQRSLRPDHLVPLPGTRKEAEALRHMVPSARVLLGKEATKPALLSLSAPGILHIATHGLFADDPTGLNHSRAAHSHFEEDSTPTPNHPLLRSALALAGAAAYQPPADAQALSRPDGLVTALELSGMNLWGTQLVVLSACNTGRGHVELGQGVYGLRRAVITAGAETLATSLWKVNDEATQELMTSYYQGLRRGEGRSEAMKKAAWEMRKKWSHPYYWASFIVIGRGEPLRGIW